MDALIDKELFYGSNNGEFLNFTVPLVVGISRRRKKKKAAKELGMSVREYKDYVKKEDQIEGMYPVSNDAETIKFYITELKKLQEDYRKKTRETKNAKDRRQFSALLSFVTAFITEKEADLKDIEKKGKLPEEEVPPTPPTPPAPPVPPTPAAPPTGGGTIGGSEESDESLADDKKGINKNLLIYGGLGLVGLLLVVKLLRK
jgi:hypothetical protein